MKVTFLGDIALNGNYIENYKAGHNPFINIQNDLSNSDYVVGNLESFAKGGKGENVLKEPRLTTTVETLNYLNSIHLDVACLANNHVYDHLEDGFFKTTSFLSDNDIKYLGAASNKRKASKPVILEKSGIKIGLLNYVTHDTNPKIPETAEITPNYFEFNKAICDIKKLKPNVHHVVLSLHWGGRVEGGMFPDYDQPSIARKLIDAGADLIVGHHSHTVQPFETYKGKYIFYSLGNFCFSDYWFDGKFYPLPKRRRLTGILNVSFNQSVYSTDVSIYRNYINDFNRVKSYPITFYNLGFKYFFKKKTCWILYYFHLKTILPVYLFIVRNDITLKQKVERLYSSLLRRIKKRIKIFNV